MASAKDRRTVLTKRLRNHTMPKGSKGEEGGNSPIKLPDPISKPIFATLSDLDRGIYELLCQRKLLPEDKQIAEQYPLAVQHYNITKLSKQTKSKESAPVTNEAKAEDSSVSMDLSQTPDDTHHSGRNSPQPSTSATASQANSALINGELLGNNNPLTQITFSSLTTNPNNNKRNFVDRSDNEEDPTPFKVPSIRLTAKAPTPAQSWNFQMPLINPFTNLPNNVTNSTNSNDNSDIQNSAPQTPRIRPISAYNAGNWRELNRTLEENFGKVFDLKPSGEFIRIFPKTADHHRAISSFLKEKNVQCIVTQLGVAKPIKIVIRGLPIDVTEEEIKLDLESRNFQIIAVHQLTKRKTGNKMPLYQVQLPNTTQSKEIFKINKMFNMIIGIENYRSPFKTTQCFACQFYHHSSESCFMKVRCVKCGQGHKSQDCPHGPGKIPEEFLLCCNCKGKHPASYRACPKFPENRSRNKPQQPRNFQNFNFSQNLQNSTNFPGANAPRGAPATYAQAAQSQFSTSSPALIPNPVYKQAALKNLTVQAEECISTFDQIKNLLKETNELLGINTISDILKSVISLNEKLRKGITQEQRTLIFLEHFSNPTSSAC